MKKLIIISALVCAINLTAEENQELRLLGKTVI